MISKNRNLRIFLFNYFIKVGSFANLQKFDSKLYRELLAYKKQKAPESKLSLSEWLITQLLYKYAPPKKTKNIWRVNEYNSLLYSIAINISDEVNKMEHLPTDMLTGFHNVYHLKRYEPAYYKFFENRVPRWQGPVPEGYPGILKVEGYKYWGNNLTEQCDFVDDLLSFFKGNTDCQYLTPYITYRVKTMLAKHGNLNLIGMDSMDLIYDLNNLKCRTGVSSISELLALDGYIFEPIDYTYGDKAVYLKRKSNYAVVLDGCDKEIIIAKEIYTVLQELGALQKIFTQTHDVRGSKVEVLYAELGGSTIPVHSLYTRDTESFYFKDRNTLNLRLANLA